VASIAAKSGMAWMPKPTSSADTSPRSKGTPRRGTSASRPGRPTGAGAARPPERTRHQQVLHACRMDTNVSRLSVTNSNACAQAVFPPECDYLEGCSRTSTLMCGNRSHSSTLTDFRPSPRLFASVAKSLTRLLPCSERSGEVRIRMIPSDGSCCRPYLISISTTVLNTDFPENLSFGLHSDYRRT
jgi:hypothetical protein